MTALILGTVALIFAVLIGLVATVCAGFIAAAMLCLIAFAGYFVWCWVRHGYDYVTGRLA